MMTPVEALQAANDGREVTTVRVRMVPPAMQAGAMFEVEELQALGEGGVEWIVLRHGARSLVVAVSVALRCATPSKDGRAFLNFRDCIEFDAAGRRLAPLPVRGNTVRAVARKAGAMVG